ncbi:MAG TPA: hypothetical protein VFW35_07940 [Sphingomicrobium sp.]|nr:hypothetical protein [Sphingomicrobium sp.]
MGFAAMSEDSDRFRTRAQECRRLSRDARDEETRARLAQMAEELDEEADMIEAEEGNETGPRAA